MIENTPQEDQFGPPSFEVLIVDDDDEVLLKLEDVLEGAGYRTTTAWCAHDAQRLLQERRFDLILLDDYLGGADWREVLQRLGPMSAGTPFVVLHPAPRPEAQYDATWGTVVRAVVYKRAVYEVLETVRSCMASSVYTRPPSRVFGD